MILISLRPAADPGQAPKPRNLTFEQAAAIPVAGCTALQGLRDKAHVQPGQSVLIYGAGGGVGTFAVQIAKSLGAGDRSAVSVERGSSRPAIRGNRRCSRQSRHLGPVSVNPWGCAVKARNISGGMLSRAMLMAR